MSSVDFLRNCVDFLMNGVYNRHRYSDQEENIMGTCDDEIPLLHLLPLLHRIIGLTETHREFGVTKSQIIIFVVLHYRGSVTMSEIAKYISSSKEQATRAVAALCDNGLVERYEDPHNRTHVYIRFTWAGKVYMEQLNRKIRTDIFERLTSSLDDGDIQDLNQAVRTTVEILSKVK